MKTPLPIALALLLALLPPAARAFTATDASTNEPYASQTTWNLGDNGGTGFGGWRQIVSEPSRGLDAQGFAISGAGGVGRAFLDDASAPVSLPSGTFSVDAWHGFADSFSGFALLADGDTELIRWGVTTTEDRETGQEPTGLWYAPLADGTPRYNLLAPLSSEDILNSRTTYSITWSVCDTGLSVDLSVTSVALTDTFHLTLDTSSAVTSIAALVAGSTQSDTLHFDNLSVTGPAVPEPATLSLFLLGTLILRPFRRK
jgi:hypothetical protein